jgi:hypothetical protein
MATDEQHFQACRRFQEYYDAALQQVGTSAPAPRPGQRVNDYRRETLRQLKRTFLPQNHPLYQVQMRDLRADALNVFEPQVLQATVKEAVNPAHLAPGELRPIERRDALGNKHIAWIGQESFVKAMGRPGRRVLSFTTDRGRYNVAKGNWF